MCRRLQIKGRGPFRLLWKKSRFNCLVNTISPYKNPKQSTRCWHLVSPVGAQERSSLLHKITHNYCFFTNLKRVADSWFLISQISLLFFFVHPRFPEPFTLLVFVNKRAVEFRETKNKQANIYIKKRKALERWLTINIVFMLASLHYHHFPLGGCRESVNFILLKHLLTCGNVGELHQFLPPHEKLLELATPPCGTTVVWLRELEDKWLLVNWKSSKCGHECRFLALF